MGESVSLNTKTMVRPAKTVRSLRLGIDIPLLITVITLLAVGLLMVYSASWKPSLQLTGSTDYFFLNQLKWAFVGVIGATLVTFLDYRMLRHIVVPLMFITLVLLVLVLIFGDDRLNSRRSLMNGSVQPSEMAKLVIIIYLSYWLYTKQDKINIISFGLIPLAFILAITAGLILEQPDISAAMTVILLGGLLFYLAGGEWRQILLVGLVVGALLIVVVTVFPTGQQRFAEYIRGLQDPVQSSFHIRRSVEAIVNGGLFGVGIGKGTTKFTGLPVTHTDSIFAVIAEETGLVGCFLVVGLYIALLWRGLTIANKAPDMFGKLLAAGVTLWITIEALINMGVMVNLIPFAGNALPLISAGGSSMVMTMGALGLLMNVARISNIESKNKEGRAYSAVVDLRGRNRRGSVSRVSRPTGPRQ